MNSGRPSLAARAGGTALPDTFDYAPHALGTVRRVEGCILAGWIVTALMPFAAALAWASRHGIVSALVAFVITAIIAVAISASVAVSVSRSSWLIAAVTIAGTLVLTFATTSLAVWLLGFIQVGLLVTAMIGRSNLVATRPFLPRADDRLLAPRVINQPGIGLMSGQALNESGMSEDNLRKGMIGEQLSNELFVNSLAEAQMDGVVQIVNGLKFPGTTDADIDHALVCGNRVILVDSKYWTPGPYRWFGDAIIGGVGENQMVRKTNFGAAVDMVRQMFGSVEVQSAILIHPNRRGVTTVDNSLMGSHPPLISASDGIAPLLSWLKAGLPADADQYRRLQTHSMRTVLSITGGFAPPVVAPSPVSSFTPLAPGEAPPSVVGTTLRATGSEAAKVGRWYLSHRRTKKAKQQMRVARQIEAHNQRHAAKMQRRGEQVLRMQHDELNARRRLFKKKRW